MLCRATEHRLNWVCFVLAVVNRQLINHLPLLQIFRVENGTSGTHSPGDFVTQIWLRFAKLN